MKINNRSLYDDKFLKGIDNAGYTKTPSLIKDFDTYYNIEGDIHKFTIPKNMQTYFNSIGTSKYFSTDALYKTMRGTRDDAYYEVLEKYKTNNSIIDPNAGKPIDPSNIFQFSNAQINGQMKNNYINLGYIRCETKNRNMIVRLSSSPENIQDSLSVNTATASAIGMSQDYNFFTGVSSRVVSFTFKVFADYLPEPYTDVISYCRDLKQMNYPTYSSNYVNSPSVTFVYGGLSITGIPTINITYGDTIKKNLVDKAVVSVSITETTKIVNGTIN